MVSSWNIQKLSQAFLLLGLIIAFLVLAKSVLVPLISGVLLTILMTPGCNFLEKKGVGRIWAIIWYLTVIFLFLASIGWLFSSQLATLMPKLETLISGVSSLADTFEHQIVELFDMNKSEGKEMVKKNLDSAVGNTMPQLVIGLAASTSTLIGIGMTLIYLFLFLLYRSPFKNFITSLYPKDNHDEVHKLLEQVKTLLSSYISGLFSVILILGILNSIGLWLIGISSPFLWGFFAASLAIIPYVGTFIGGILPVIYAIVSLDTVWQPVAIMGWFIFVQALEGNLITPKVVGKQIDINPIFAILGLIVGELIWGVSGMILALPLLAVGKVILDQSKNGKSLAVLMGTDIYDKDHIFTQRFNTPRFQLFRKSQKKDKNN